MLYVNYFCFEDPSCRIFCNLLASTLLGREGGQAMLYDDAQK